MNILILGATGQDGSLMIEFILKNFPEHKVFGTARASSTNNTQNISENLENPNLKILRGDLNDDSFLQSCFYESQPDLCFNFAGVTSVAESWQYGLNTLQMNTVLVAKVLENIRKYFKNCRFFTVSSSEIFSDAIYQPQDLNHPLRPTSIYGASKVAAGKLVEVYRKKYNIFACQAIAYGHESKKRTSKFLVGKVTMAVAEAYLKFKTAEKIIPVQIGDTTNCRDWSAAEDFIEGFWKQINHSECQDFIFASGELHTVRDVIDSSLASVLSDNNLGGMSVLSDLNFETIFVEDPKFFRNENRIPLLGDSTETRKILNWQPKISFEKMIDRMVQHRLNLIYAKEPRV